jgi:hypothetical protein
MEQGAAIELRERRFARVALEKFAEQEGLLAQGLGAFVVGEQVHEFVAENGDATGFQSHDWDARFDLWLELIEDFEQQRLRAIEHAEVIEGASAAEIGLRDEDAVSGGFENFDGGFGGRGQEVIVEGVGPQENFGG